MERKDDILRFSLKDSVFTEKKSLGQKGVESSVSSKPFIPLDPKDYFVDSFGVAHKTTTTQAIPQKIDTTREASSSMVGEPIGIRETLKHLPTLKEQPKIFAASASMVAEKFLPTKWLSALDSRLHLGEALAEIDKVIVKGFAKVQKGIGMESLSSEEIDRIFGDISREYSGFKGELETIKEENPLARNVAHFGGEIMNYVLISKFFAGLTPAAFGKLTSARFTRFSTTFPGGDRAAMVVVRMLSEAASKVPTFAMMGILEEAAEQIEYGQFSPIGLLEEMSVGALRGTLHSVGGAFHTYPVRIFATGMAGGAFAAMESLIKNGQITKDDVPSIIRTAGLWAVFEAITSMNMTKVYEEQVMANRTKWQMYDRYGKEFTDTLNRVHYLEVLHGGDKTELGRSFRDIKNKLLTQTKLLNKDYIIKGGSGATYSYIKPREGTDIVSRIENELINSYSRGGKYPIQDIRLNKFLTPAEKLTLQHIDNTMGKNVPFITRMPYQELVMEARLESPEVRAVLDEAGLPTSMRVPTEMRTAEVGVSRLTDAVSKAEIPVTIPTFAPPKVEDITELREVLKETKGMTADDIMAKHPDIKLKKDVPAKDVYGEKTEILKGEVLTPYELKDNKILLQDGETYVVSKSQYQNIKGHSEVEGVKDVIPDDKIRLYRGLTKEFDPSYDKSDRDAPTGYSLWTDSEELARAYAGDEGFVYQMDLPKEEIGESFIDEQGERPLFYKTDKPASIHGVKGEEYAVYEHHDLFSDEDIRPYKLEAKEVITETKPTTPTEKITKEPIGTSKRITPTERKMLGIEELRIIKRNEYSLLKDKIKTLSRGYREGGVLSRKEVSEVQAEYKKAIQDTKLPASEKNSLMRGITKVQTQSQLNRAIPELEARIDEVIEKLNKRDAVRELRKAIESVNKSKLRPEFRKEIEDILDDVDVFNTSNKKLTELEKTADFLINNPETVLPDRVIKSLERLGKTPLKELSIDDIKNITDAINHAHHLSKRKTELVYIGKRRSAKKILDQAVSNLKKRSPKNSVDSLSTEETIKEAGAFKKFIYTDSLNPETFAFRLDGATEMTLEDLADRTTRGVVNDENIIGETFFNAFSDASNARYKYIQDTQDMVLKEIKDAGINLTGWSRQITLRKRKLNVMTLNLPDAGKIKLLKADRLAIILNERVPYNRRNLMEAGFSFELSPTKVYKLSEEDIKAIIDSATKEEWTVVDIFEKYYPIAKDAINEKSIEVNGIEIAKNDIYYPVKTNTLYREIDTLKGKVTPGGITNFTKRTLEGMNILIPKKDVVAPIVLRDPFKVMFQHTKNVGAYIGYATPLRNAKMLLSSPEFKTTLINHWGKENLNYLRKYIKDIEEVSPEPDALEKLQLGVLRKADIAILAGNVFVMAKQPVSYIAAATMIHPKYLTEGDSRYTYEKTRAEMKKHSPFLRNRIDQGAIDIDVGEHAKVGEVLNFFTGKHILGDKLMIGIHKMDMEAIGRIWESVKVEIKNKLPGLSGDNYWKVVEARTRQVIERTQPTYEVHSRSGISRSRAVGTRLLTKYSTQRNKNFNMLARSVARFNASGKKPKDFGNLLKDIFLIAFMSALVIAGINELRKMLFKKDKDDEEDMAWYWRIALDASLSNISTVYIAGDAVSSMVSKIRYGTFAGWDMSNIFSSFLDNTIDVVADTWNLVDQLSSKEVYKIGDKKGEEKWRTTLPKVLKKSLEPLGVFVGLPLKDANNWIELFYRNAVNDGYIGEEASDFDSGIKWSPESGIIESRGSSTKRISPSAPEDRYEDINKLLKLR